MGVIADKIANWYVHFHEVETVTLTPKPVGTADTSVSALRGKLSKRGLALAATGAVNYSDITFLMFTATMSLTPKNGDTITDSSARVYTIMDVADTCLETQWEAICRPQV